MPSVPSIAKLSAVSRLVVKYAYSGIADLLKGIIPVALKLDSAYSDKFFTKQFPTVCQIEIL